MFPISHFTLPLTLESVSEAERLVPRQASDWVSFTTESFLQKSLLLTDFSVESSNKVSKSVTKGATEDLLTILEMIGWLNFFLS